LHATHSHFHHFSINNVFYKPPKEENLGESYLENEEARELGPVFVPNDQEAPYPESYKHGGRGEVVGTPSDWKTVPAGIRRKAVSSATGKNVSPVTVRNEVAKNAPITFAMCVFPFVSPTAQRIFMKFDAEKFHTNSSTHSNFGKNRTTIMDTLHKDLHGFWSTEVTLKPRRGIPSQTPRLLNLVV
jgi:hypothetical protein